MSQHEKLFVKARRNPNGLSFSEFQNLMVRCGWVKDRQKGSHQIWYSPEGERITVQVCGGMAKGYQVRQFLRKVEEERENG